MSFYETNMEIFIAVFRLLSDDGDSFVTITSL